MRDLKKQADAMTPPEHRGMMGGFRAMTDGVAQANQMVGQMAEEGQRAQHLMANGIFGQGTITSLRDTGMTVNDNPRVELDLTVALPGRDPYAVTHIQTVSRLAIAGFQPGATVPVRVDPVDPAQMIIA